MASVKVTTFNGVKVYNVTAGKTLPQWLSEKKKKALRKDKDYRNRIELVQDLEFPIASTRIKFSRDGQYLAATGVYQPQMRLFELKELSMKCSRHLDAEVIHFDFLSDDYKKLAFLRADRVIEFHAQFGLLHKIRIPKFGRHFSYHSAAASLIAVGSGSEAWRVDLEQGRFLKGFETSLPGINCCDINESIQATLFAGENGTVECWDLRHRRCAGSLNLVPQILRDSTIVPSSPPEVSFVKMHEDGLHYAVGTSNGLCYVYDLRTSSPLSMKDHQHGLPITNIEFHDGMGEKKVISSDKTLIKIWDRESGELFTSIEPPCAINSFTCAKDTGLIVVAGEQQRLPAFFIPSLGPAPKWCSFLDLVTEELEEDKRRTTVYDDFKFVTKDEIQHLGMEHLVGTGMLKPYMHGFFMDAKLYNKLRAVADPFAFEKYRKEKIKAKLDGKTGQRITLKKRLPKVNKFYAAELMSKGAENAKEKEKVEAELLEDSRFASLFENPDFEIDTSSEAYKTLHPTSKKTSAEELDELLESLGGVVEADDIDKSSIPSNRSNGVSQQNRQDFKAYKMLEVSTGLETDALFGGSESVKRLKNERTWKRQPLKARVQEETSREHSEPVVKRAGRMGEAEMTFDLEEERRKKREIAIRNKANDPGEKVPSRAGLRRGVKSLGLKDPTIRKVRRR